MKTNILLALDTRRADKHKKYPIILRVSHQRRTTSITMGYKIIAEDWDIDRRCIKKTHKGSKTVSELNNYLSRKKASAEQIVSKLDFDGRLDKLNVTELKTFIVRDRSETSFTDFAEMCIADLEKTNKYGNARMYRQALSFIQRKTGGQDIEFNDITPQLLSKLEIEFIQEGKTLNGLSTYLRAIRAIFNRAIRLGLVERNVYPFDRYTIKSSPTRKRAMKLEDLFKFKELKLEPFSTLAVARDTALISLHLRGANFADIASLIVANIRDGRIVYRRNKTGKIYDIKISEELMELLTPYLKNKDADEYILPYLKPDAPEVTHRRLIDARKRFNKRLKVLAQVCGIENNITSYSIRHTFATEAKRKGIPIVAISEMLGHSSVKTTQVYLADLPSEVLDDYTDKVLG